MPESELTPNIDPISTPFFDVLIQGHFLPGNIVICDTGESLSKPQELERIIEENWANRSREAEERGVTLRDDQKVLLMDCTVVNGNIILRLGRTDYKSHIGTRDFLDVRTRFPEFVPRLLSTAAVLETADNYFVINQRKGVSRYPDWIGALGGDSNITDVDEGGNINPSTTILREVSEEVRIPEENVEITNCLGLMRVIDTGVEIFMFHAKSNLTRMQIEQEQKGKPLEEGPSLFVPIDPKSVRRIILHFSRIFVSDGAAVLTLLGRERFGEDWFQLVLDGMSRRIRKYNRLSSEQLETIRQRKIDGLPESVDLRR